MPLSQSPRSSEFGLLKAWNLHIILTYLFEAWTEDLWIFLKRNFRNQFLFPILRCWMIFPPLLKSESFTSSTIDHTFSMERRKSEKLVHFWWKCYHNIISSLDNNERLYWTNKNPLSKIKWIYVKFSKLNDIINARMQICFSRLPSPPDSLFWQV